MATSTHLTILFQLSTLLLQPQFTLSMSSMRVDTIQELTTQPMLSSQRQPQFTSPIMDQHMDLDTTWCHTPFQFTHLIMIQCTMPLFTTSQFTMLLHIT